MLDFDESTAKVEVNSKLQGPTTKVAGIRISDLQAKTASQRGSDWWRQFRMVKMESKSEIPILIEAKPFDISLLGNFPDFDGAKSKILDFDSILAALK